jgi:hypothetical protein
MLLTYIVWGSYCVLGGDGEKNQFFPPRDSARGVSLRGREENLAPVASCGLRSGATTSLWGSSSGICTLGTSPPAPLFTGSVIPLFDSSWNSIPDNDLFLLVASTRRRGRARKKVSAFPWAVAGVGRGLGTAGCVGGKGLDRRTNIGFGSGPFNWPRDVCAQDVIGRKHRGLPSAPSVIPESGLPPGNKHRDKAAWEH